MSLSNVIKSKIIRPAENQILTTRAGLTDLNQDEFCTLDSLWQSGNSEYVDDVTRLKEDKDRAKRECESMLAQAQAKVAEIEKQAFDKGFASGREEALKLGREELQAKSVKIDELLKTISDGRRQLYEKYHNDVATLMQVMLERILFHEVSINPQVIKACLKATLGYVVENSTVTVHLHENDFNSLKEAGLDDPELLAGFKQLELTEDPAISEGGCLLETGFGEIDATLESRRDKLSRAIEVTFMQAMEQENKV